MTGRNQFITTRVINPDDCPNMREASEYLKSLPAERRAELEGEWE